MAVQPMAHGCLSLTSLEHPPAAGGWMSYLRHPLVRPTKERTEKLDRQPNPNLGKRCVDSLWAGSLLYVCTYE